MSDLRLNRRVQFDERSRSFPIRAALPGVVKPRGYTWRCPVVLDQGREGQCVGFGIAAEAAARPVSVPNVTDEVASRIYRRARQLDEWDGENYDGTSVLAGMKAAQEAGWYGEYRWCFGLADLRDAVSYKGPAVLGINWYQSMYQTDALGVIRVEGERVGGHCILCNAVDVKRRTFTLHNSWGPTYGVNGAGKISFDDMERLLHEQGEAVVPIKRLKPKAA